MSENRTFDPALNNFKHEVIWDAVLELRKQMKGLRESILTLGEVIADHSKRIRAIEDQKSPTGFQRQVDSIKQEVREAIILANGRTIPPRPEDEKVP